jgi:hypothetical protein
MALTEILIVTALTAIAIARLVFLNMSTLLGAEDGISFRGLDRSSVDFI